MIAYIRGELAEKSPTRVVIEAAGVGYELLIPISTYEKLPREGNEVKLFAQHVVREDDELLFGFGSEDEREMFLKLTGVSGVGPKIAVAILSGASVSELATTISAGDAKRLSAIKGVGKKTAEKICVELRDKVHSLMFAKKSEDGGTAFSPVVNDALNALRSLGFNEETSTKMVTDVLAKHPETTDLESIIKFALSSK